MASIIEKMPGDNSENSMPLTSQSASFQLQEDSTISRSVVKHAQALSRKANRVLVTESS